MHGRKMSRRGVAPGEYEHITELPPIESGGRDEQTWSFVTFMRDTARLNEWYKFPRLVPYGAGSTSLLIYPASRLDAQLEVTRRQVRDVNTGALLGWQLYARRVRRRFHDRATASELYVTEVLEYADAS